MNDIYFSVIMVSYNDCNYINKSINSVLNQTYKYYELIFVNNGSTDKTKEILSLYTDKRIKVININKNKGLPNGRNVGLKAASGKYVVFNDSDDWMDKDFLETVFNKTCKTKADRVMQEIKFYINNKLIEKLEYVKNSSKWSKNSLQGDAYKKEVIDNNNLLFNENAYFDDFYFTTQFNKYSKKENYIHESHYNMLLRDSSMTHIYSNDITYFIDKFYNTFKEIKKLNITKENIGIEEYNRFEYSCIQKYYTQIYSFINISLQDRINVYIKINKIFKDYFPYYLKNKNVKLVYPNGFCGHFKRNIWLSIKFEELDLYLKTHVFMKSLLSIYHFCIKMNIYKGY